MDDPFVAARKRQLARLGGTKPPAPRVAMVLAKSQAYQHAADAPTTLGAYALYIRIRADAGHVA